VYRFAFIDCNIELLLRSPLIVSLQFTDPHGFSSTLIALTLPYPVLAYFIFVDTAIFAYEPILTSLQTLYDIPLQDFLVNPGSTSVIAYTGVTSLRVDYLKLL